MPLFHLTPMKMYQNKTSLDIIDICSKAVDIVLVHLCSESPVTGREDDTHGSRKPDQSHNTPWIHMSSPDWQPRRQENDRVANTSVTSGTIQYHVFSVKSLDMALFFNTLRTPRGILIKRFWLEESVFPQHIKNSRRSSPPGQRQIYDTSENL